MIEAYLDSPLISRTGILESKGHGGVAIRTKGCDERRLDLVFFLEGDLVIAGVTVKEGEKFVAGGGVYNLIYPRQTRSDGRCGVGRQGGRRSGVLGDECLHIH